MKIILAFVILGCLAQAIAQSVIPVAPVSLSSRVNSVGHAGASQASDFNAAITSPMGVTAVLSLTSTTENPTSTWYAPDSPSSMNAMMPSWVIVVGAVGGVLGLVIIITFGSFVIRKKRPAPTSAENGSTLPTVESNERPQVQHWTQDDVYDPYADYPNEEK